MIGASVGERSLEQFGGTLAAPTRRDRAFAIGAIAAAVLVLALAAAAVVLAVSRPGPALAATLTVPGGASSAAFSPDGTTLAVLDAHGSSHLRNVANRHWTATLTSGNALAGTPRFSSVRTAARSPSSALLAAARACGTSPPGGRSPS